MPSSPIPTTPYLLTGVTGGLGSRILHDMLHVHRVPARNIIATSRSETRRAEFEDQGLRFRLADFRVRETLERALEGVEQVLLVSSSERDSDVRIEEHRNVVEAAVKMGVKKVWYVSLAFGGWEDGSKIGFQQAHYETERVLQRSGLDFVSLRAGIYADAFPLFLNWYPSSRAVLMPNVTPPVEQGKIAFTSRDELGEGIATLLAKGLDAFPSIRPKTEKRIVLLTALETNSLVDLVGAINRGRRTDMKVEYLEPREWVEEEAKDDEGGKSREYFESRLGFVQGICGGDAEVMDPALETLLGRKPETGVQSVERMVQEDPQFRWHQSYRNGRWPQDRK